MLNVGQGQPAQSLAQGAAQRCANSLGLDTKNGSTGQSSVGRGKVGTFVGHFVANSTYFNHVNLLRKHLLCFLHTITTTGNCRRRRLPQTKWGKGSGCSAFSLSLSLVLSETAAVQISISIFLQPVNADPSFATLPPYRRYWL